jgi:exodeoxyribonuclease VII large subunit
MNYTSPWPVQIYTVTQLTSRIRDCIHKQFRDVLVEGEISNFKVYPSGHLYFTLKDNAAALRVVMFNFQGKFPEGVIKDGTSVICRGKVDVYEKRGEYRLLADDIEVRGLGLLQVKFELLKEKLFNEGLFDVSRKRPLPLLPQRIGIITSPAGAAIRDMLKIILSKFENMRVLIYPVRVQGDQACSEVVEAIDYFNRTDEADVLIVGRGGGSLEDLACFNDEMVARAIHASRIPIVSGVGHEIDFTIADLVADVRAPTPTAAADMVVRDKRELRDSLRGTEQRLIHLMKKRVEGSRLLLYKEVVELKEKRDFIVKYRMYLDELLNTLVHNFSTLFTEKRTKLQGCAQRLGDLNPDNILKRGYSITVKGETGAVIRDASQVAVNDQVSVRLYRGLIDCVVEGTSKDS